jgi:hypothetical protein
MSITTGTRHTAAAVVVAGVASFATSCASNPTQIPPSPSPPPIVVAEAAGPPRSGPPHLYPNATLTPGAVNPAVTQATIATTICQSGWTATVRPSSSFTTKLKKEQIAAQHLAGSTKDYEEDHLVSLELGGHPTSKQNLWPEPYSPKPGARQKDRVENFLHDAVCHGEMTLQHAQDLITTDWYAEYQKIGAPVAVGDSDDTP